MESITIVSKLPVKGIQYGIQAFGEEAIALYNETMNFIEENLDIVNNKLVS